MPWTAPKPVPVIVAGSPGCPVVVTSVMEDILPGAVNQSSKAYGAGVLEDMPLTAVYAGSFDPPTLGHQDLALRSLKFCDRLVIAIGKNSAKKPLFTLDERLDMLQHLFKPFSEKISVVSFQGLLVEYCRAESIPLIVRGLRTSMDFEYELGIAHVNAEQAGEDHGLPKIDTIFLPTSQRIGAVSSSFVRELASHGANLHRYVDPYVEQRLKAHFAALSGKV